MSDGPYLIFAAFWSDEDVTEQVAEAIRSDVFPRVPGFDRGQVVSFHLITADLSGFRRALERFDLAELNARP